MNKKNIEEFIAAEKSRSEGVLVEKIDLYFSDIEQQDKADIVFEAFTRYPFGVLKRFHEWAFGSDLAGKSVDEYLKKDSEAHTAMQKDNLDGFFISGQKKTDAERYEYFSGISTIFPLMMTANYHNWVSDAIEGVGDFGAFVDSYMPKIVEKYHGVLNAAYDAGDNGAKKSAYVFIAKNNIYEILREYYNWLIAQL